MREPQQGLLVLRATAGAVNAIEPQQGLLLREPQQGYRATAGAINAIHSKNGSMNYIPQWYDNHTHDKSYCGYVSLKV